MHFNEPIVLIKTVASTTVPERISAEPRAVSFAIVYGLKAARTANAGDVWIGPGATDGVQVGLIEPSQNFTLQKTDLYDWYIDVATIGDGVVVLYW